MRPLSRLLSVFLALILAGTALATVAAHDETADAAAPIPEGKDIVSVSVELLTDKDPAHPHGELEFLVSIYRLDVGHKITGIELFKPGEDITGTGISMDDLDDSNAYSEKKVPHTIDPLGADVGSRQVSLIFTVTFMAENNDADGGNPHTGLSAEGKETVNGEKRPDVEAGVSGVLLDFGDPPEPAIEKGAEIKFTVTVSTGRYSFDGESVVITRQGYKADGDEDGPAIPVLGITIPALETDSKTDALPTPPKAYKLSQQDVDFIDDGGSIEFAYSFDITEVDIKTDINKDDDLGTDAAGTPVPADGDLSTITTPDKVETVKATLLTLPLVAPEPEATPEPPAGMNEHATVVREGNRIDITRTDNGETISLQLGVIYPTGDSYHNPRGYIRDVDKGQTYAVVIRESDDSVVRVWIAPNTDAAKAVPWTDVVANYSVPVGVLSAITLDDMNPANNQLVRSFVGDEERIYVYQHGAWRWIPDIPTFEAFGFFWCDITAADADFFDRVMPGNPLPPSGGSADPGYPSCHTQ